MVVGGSLYTITNKPIIHLRKLEVAKMNIKHQLVIVKPRYLVCRFGACVLGVFVRPPLRVCWWLDCVLAT